MFVYDTFNSVDTMREDRRKQKNNIFYFGYIKHSSYCM